MKEGIYNCHYRNINDLKINTINNYTPIHWITWKKWINFEKHTNLPRLNLK